MQKIGDITHLLETAEYAAREAGKAIMEIYQQGDILARAKPGEFPITPADQKSHRIISEILAKTNLPVLSEEGIHVDFRERKHWDYFWIVDPLDGTKEFIDKNGEFTINIALVQKSRPIGGVIYVPVTDTLYRGSAETGVYRNEKGNLSRLPPLRKRIQFEDLLKKKNLSVVVSRSHISSETNFFINKFLNPILQSAGSSIKFMLLLENKADIYPRFGSTMEWDTAAAQAILNTTNRGVYQTDLKSELIYNKPDLTNPYFIAF